SLVPPSVALPHGVGIRGVPRPGGLRVARLLLRSLAALALALAIAVARKALPPASLELRRHQVVSAQLVARRTVGSTRVIRRERLRARREEVLARGYGAEVVRSDTIAGPA